MVVVKRLFIFAQLAQFLTRVEGLHELLNFSRLFPSQVKVQASATQGGSLLGPSGYDGLFLGVALNPCPFHWGILVFLVFSCNVTQIVRY